MKLNEAIASLRYAVLNTPVRLNFDRKDQRLLLAWLKELKARRDRANSWRNVVKKNGRVKVEYYSKPIAVPLSGVSGVTVLPQLGKKAPTVRQVTRELATTVKPFRRDLKSGKAKPVRDDQDPL